MWTARRWREHYAEERAALGEVGLDACLDRAPPIDLPAGGALIFPHTHLRAAGHLVGAVARAVIELGAETVVALGVLHGGREDDAAAVARARAGDPAARAALRRVHGEGIPGDQGVWREEFSLDGFAALLARAAARAGRAAPRVLARYPFLVGDDPESLAGLDELRRLCPGQAALVATADPLHYGVGYEMAAARRASDDPQSLAWAAEVVGEGFRLLAEGAYPAFAAHAARHRSDFRDAGPTLAALLGPPFASLILSLVLVDYAETLMAPPPTWVAGALGRFSGGVGPQSRS